MKPRATAFAFIVIAAFGVLLAGMTGEWTPLIITAVFIAFATMIGVGEVLLGREED